MSFEGFMEKLCTNGHYFSCDVYTQDEFIKECPTCNSPFEYQHLVDITNGYEEDNPSTYPGTIEEIGFDDEWHVDHYGNRYAIKIHKFKPVGDQWKKIL